jgi:drug/metabolite transporter (DMT)-like permease
MEVALKLVGTKMDPLQITFLRFLAGGLILAPFAVHSAGHLSIGVLTKKVLVRLALLGVLNITCCMAVYQYSLRFYNASTGALIFCSNPIFTMLFSHIFTSNDRLTRRKVVAMVTGLSGLVLLINPWEMKTGNILLGMTLTLFATIVFSLYSVLSGKISVHTGAFVQTSVSFISGALFLLIILILTGRPVFAGIAQNFAVLFYVSVVVTGFGFLSYFYVIHSATATMGSIAFFLKPILAPIAAMVILHETIQSISMYVGIAFVLAASCILLFRQDKPAKIN